MSLGIQPWYFTDCTDNLTGTPPAALIGTNFTAGASNADGTVVEVLGDLTHDVQFLVIAIGGINTSAANNNALLDVLVDPAGGTSWASLIDDLVCGFTPTPAAGTVGLQVYYYFPLYIKAGASLAVQARNASAGDITTGRVCMWAYGNPSRPDSWWCGSKVESLGINAASSSGTTVTAGNSGSFGSWTSIGASSFRYGAVQFGMNGSDQSALAVAYHWQLGVGSAQLPGSPTLWQNTTIQEQSARSGMSPIFCDVLASTTWQIRGTCSGTAENYNGAVYGVY